MADYSPLFDGGSITMTASVDVVGGQAVEITGDRMVGPAGAASTKYVGVAGYSAKAGQKLTVILPGKVQRIKASGAIAAGAVVQCGAAGTVAAGTVAPIGKALAAAADGALVPVADRI